MRQLFFLPLNATPPNLTGATCHIWADGEKFIGVVHMDGHCDAEQVIEQLEAQGIEWLPNHQRSEKIAHHHAQALAKYGVNEGDTTLDAMTKVHAMAGFPPLKPRRF